jgi:hypothetical protein
MSDHFLAWSKDLSDPSGRSISMFADQPLKGRR